MTTASIVIHNTPPDMLLRAVNSLASSHVDILYIIDNSPVPNRPVLPGYADMTVVYIPVDNHGFGAAHNIAIRNAIEAGSDWHLVMNPDVEWNGDALTPLVGYMEINDDVAMVMPRVIYPDGTLQYACRMLPTPWDLMAKRFLPKALTGRRMRRYLLAGADHSRPFNCPYLLGSCLLFRTAALLKEGAFDERFFMYPEDIDITRRMHRNWRTMYLPLSTVVHRHAAASRHSLKMLRIHLANMCRYFGKWGWWHDPERRRFNQRLLSTMPRYPRGTTPPAGRG